MISLLIVLHRAASVHIVVEWTCYLMGYIVPTSKPLAYIYWQICCSVFGRRLRATFKLTINLTYSLESCKIQIIIYYVLFVHIMLQFIYAAFLKKITFLILVIYTSLRKKQKIMYIKLSCRVDLDLQVAIAAIENNKKLPVSFTSAA